MSVLLHRLGKKALAAALAGGLLAPVAPTAPTPAVAGGVLRIMPLGDSITRGVGESPHGNGYRVHLQRRLTTAGVTFDFVGSQSSGRGGDRDHEGHPAWTIDQLAAEVDGWIERHRPHVVLLHAGTNNITRGEDPREVAGKLSGLIDRVARRLPAAQIFVSTVVGTRVAGEVPANRAYNRLIPGVVAGKGPRVHLVDQSAVRGLSLYDRHHPNDFGYQQMAYTWYQALRAGIAPYWRAPSANPHARTRHVLLPYYDYVRKAPVRAYWSQVKVTRDGVRTYRWVRDRVQKP